MATTNLSVYGAPIKKLAKGRVAAALAALGGAGALGETAYQDLTEEGHPHLKREADAGLQGALAGGVGGLFTSKNPLAGAGIGAAVGGLGSAASQRLGDAILGVSDDKSGLTEFGHGALGGGLIGAGAGALIGGKMRGGMALYKSLLQKGISPKKAIAMIMGIPTAIGAGIGSLNSGLNSLGAYQARQEAEE